MAFTQNFNSNTFGPVQWKLMGPIADRPATADLHTTYLSTDEGDGVLKAYLFTESGWMQMQGIEGFTGGGSGGGGSVVNLGVTVTTENQSVTFTLDKTWAEINEITDAGGVVYLKTTDDTAGMIQGNNGGVILYLGSVGLIMDVYIVTFFSVFSGGESVEITFSAESENDYPAHTESGK